MASTAARLASDRLVQLARRSRCRELHREVEKANRTCNVRAAQHEVF